MLKVRDIKKSFPQGSGELHILRGLNLEVFPGEALSIVGASGAGKSTFLHILGTLDRPTSGEVLYRGESLFKKTDEELALFRNQKVGFVFQFHHLLSEFSAEENIMMPGRIAGRSARECRKRADELISILGIDHRRSHFPSEMSGGEQQRVAIARALFCQPEILMADEPTGNLDTDNSLKIQDLFFELKQELHLTLIVVTHDSQFANRFARTLRMADGMWVES